MKKIKWIAIASTLLASTMIVGGTKQVGAALEERNNFLDGYAYFNQLVQKRFFYEFRAVYIHNYRVMASASGLPITEQRNLDGAGVVGILGYNFYPNERMTVTPFIREQYLTNVISAYKDTAGNKLDSHAFTSYLGLKLAMKVTDALSIISQYFGGYQTSKLYGKGVFASTAKPSVHSWTSVLEVDLPYKMTSLWTLTPYVQWVTTSNNPNTAAFGLPSPVKQTGITTTTAVYALKLGYAFN